MKTEQEIREKLEEAYKDYNEVDELLWNESSELALDILRRQRAATFQKIVTLRWVIGENDYRTLSPPHPL